MTVASSLTVRPFEERDEDAVVAAWTRETPTGEYRPAERSAALFRWQYLDAPDGSRLHITFDGDGRVLAQIAAVRRRVWVAGESIHWLWVNEVLNQPSDATSLGRHTPVLRCAQAFFESYGGAPPEAHPMLVGFPNRAAFRLGFYRCGAESMRNQNKLCLVPKALRGDFDHDVTVTEATSFDADVDGLFERARERYGAIAVRDAAHLNWRFTQHPQRTYRIGCARRPDGTLVGYAVFHHGSYDGRRDGLVADWLTDPAEPAAGHALRRWLAERAEEAGAELLTAVLPDTCPEWMEFQHAGFRVQATADFLMGRAYQRPHDIVWAHRHWYYTLGDFDRC